MKNLNLDQMEKVNGGMNSCSWGMLAVGVGWGAAISLTGGAAAIVAGAIYSAGWSVLTDSIC